MKAARKPASGRHSLYAKISIAQKQLGLDEDTFRDILEGRYGVRSRTKMSDAQLADLLKYFEAQGFQPRPRSGKPKGAARREHGKMRAQHIQGDIPWHSRLICPAKLPSSIRTIRR